MKYLNSMYLTLCVRMHNHTLDNHYHGNHHLVGVEPTPRTPVVQMEAQAACDLPVPALGMQGDKCVMNSLLQSGKSNQGIKNHCTN